MDKQQCCITGMTIRYLRIKENLSQQQLANVAEINKSHLVRIESGKVNITLTTLIRICDALGVSPWEFLYDIVEKTKKETNCERISNFV